MRRVVVIVALLLAGCVSTEVETGPLSSKKVEQPAVTPATLALSAKVDQIGSELVSQSPFLGVSPTFCVVGQPGIGISHPDLHGVLVSEGLAARSTDDELAAVLALELGRMSAEAKQAQRLTQPEPLMNLPSGATAAPGGNTDPNQVMIQALVNRQAVGDSRGVRSPVESATSIAKTILMNSGRDETLLQKAEAIHAEASRAGAGPLTFQTRSAPPRWTN